MEKFICTKGFGNTLTEGKIYIFQNGVVVWDDGFTTCGIELVENFNSRHGVARIAPCSPTPKDLLTVGRVVELRNGTMAFVLPDRLIAKDGWINIKNYDENCNDNSNSGYDIVRIYDAPINNGCEAWNFESRDKFGLDLIWKREEKSPQQIEKEAIQLEMEKLAKRLKELEVK